MGLGSDLTDPGSKDELSDQIVTSTHNYRLQTIEDALPEWVH